MTGQLDQGAGSPQDAGGSGSAAHRALELALAAVADEGTPAVLRVLRAARSGDAAAAGMSVGALLRALPGTSWFGAHDLLIRSGITEGARMGELDTAQRSALGVSLSHRLHPAPRTD
jgi:hypothetical protein